MTKDILLTIVWCAAFQCVSGNIRTIILLQNYSSAYFLRDTIAFPKIMYSKTGSPIYFTNDSTGVAFSIITGPCKAIDCFNQSFRLAVPIALPVNNINVFHKPDSTSVVAVKRKILHGDVSYDFSTHESPDTSFVGNSFTQHHLNANLYATLLNKYPVIFHFGTLQTSLPYVKNYVDFSLQFNRKQFGSALMNQYLTQIKGKLSEAERTDSLLHNNVIGNFNQIQSLSGWLNNDKQMQQLLNSSSLINQYARMNQASVLQSAPGAASALMHTDRDSSLQNALSNIGQIQSLSGNSSLKQALENKAKKMVSDSSSVVPDSSLKRAMNFVQEYTRKLSSLKNAKARQDSLQTLYDSLRSTVSGRRDSLEKMLASGDAGQLLKAYSDSIKEKPFIRFLMGVKQLSLGRTYLDYSRLSVKNISLLGFNMEYSNRYYFAIAAGKTDFRYLDFLSVSSVANQYLFLGRVGLGEKERRHLYLTVYTGQKQASYYIANKPATNKVTGITLETKIPVNKNISITGEIAKSSYPQYIATNSAPGKLFKFSDRNNEAYSFELTGYFPKSDTRISGVYNRLGVYFQSFNIFNNNTNSASWQVRLDQYLLKKKLFLSASARQNDFSTPFVSNNYKSQSLFYSLQASLRLRKWPVLTIGFLPYSQITKLNGEFTISRFYTLMGSSNYAYRVKRLYMTSSLIYTRYFNSSNQAGFFLYDAQNWFLNQAVLIKRFTLSGSATYAYSPGYSLLSFGPNIQWMINKSLELGGGIKYNDLDHEQRILGYNGNINVQIGRLGKIGLSFERGYIPGINNGLFRNDWGRATYNKNF